MRELGLAQEDFEQAIMGQLLQCLMESLGGSPHTEVGAAKLLPGTGVCRTARVVRVWAKSGLGVSDGASSTGRSEVERVGSEDFCRRISLTVGFILNDITYADNVLHLQGRTSGQGYKKHLDIVHDCRCKACQAILELSLAELCDITS